MIQKFRWKFIRVSVISLAIVLLVSMGAMITVSFVQAKNESNQVMTRLIQNNGQLTPANSRTIVGDPKNPFSKNFSAGQGNPDAIFQYRYFTVIVDQDQQYKINRQQNIYRLTNNKIIKAVQKTIENKDKSGEIKLVDNVYRYQVVNQADGSKMIIFLNTSLIYARSWYLLKIGTILVLGALLVFAFVLVLLSKKAIEPIISAYKKQQQFITNAGHELKTPLAIISANTEMQEMLGQDSEWTESTKEQTKRLTRLINHFLSMAKMGETGNLVLSKINYSEVVQNSSKSFSSMMKNDHLAYQVAIQEGIFVKAEKRSLEEVVNILLDNAHKYCLPNGTVKVKLRKSKLGQSAILIVSNSFKEDKKIDYANFFERFYREDESHNSKKSGFGIGLSMAQELVHVFGGKIEVNYNNEMINFMVTLKIAK